MNTGHYQLYMYVFNLKQVPSQPIEYVLFYRNPIMLALVDDVQNMHISKMSMISLNCHCVITKIDSDRQLHPVRGDLLVIEVMLGEGSRQCNVIKKLGYVVDVSKRRLTDNDMIINRKRKSCKRATYTVTNLDPSRIATHAVLTFLIFIFVFSLM